MTSTQPRPDRDYRLADLDLRARMVAQAEEKARWYNGPLPCGLCGKDLHPIEQTRPACTCPEPLVMTVDQLVDWYLRQITARAMERDQAREEAEALTTTLLGLTARSELAEATARMIASGVREFADRVGEVLGEPVS